jgi:hypothetical protein
MMTSQRLIASSIACATLLGVALIAQDNPAPTPPGNLDLTGIPAARGIYYHAADGWVALSHTLLMPFDEQRPVALEILNVGSDHAAADIPGRHSGIQIGNDARPTFYLHGISPNDVYLVHAATKSDYREIVMPISRYFKEWAHYRDKDLTDIGILALNGDIVAIKPTADLKPGEYALATGFEPGARWLRLGFDFGILGAVGQ